MNNLNNLNTNDLKSKLLIFGTNDFGEILYESLKFNKPTLGQEVIGFVVDDKYYTQEKFCDKLVYKYSELKDKFYSDEIEFLLAIGYSDMNQVRKKIFYRLLQDGYKIASYIDPNSIVRTEEKHLGQATIILENVNIGVGCRLGDGNIFYPGSTLGHHSTVGNFNFFAIRSSVAGRVKIGDECFFGNNCCTKDHISISNQTLIGAGCYFDFDTDNSGEVYVPVKSVKLKKSSMEIKLKR